MQLTPHFALAEFTRSAKAAQLRLDNTPTGKALENLKRTAEILERVRAHLGVPIIITSGYRGPVLNKAVGGATSSDHLQGLAADVLAPKFGPPYEVAKALAPHIDALGIGQII
ncbi:D-Ala-D-Ala carboxypeptidase family metallohydrolase, partial [Comamonas jiangduensis]|uniref:D-Ala-D-Ala carboxypeptidase family metallohydrolase n=1 Tax=Comamonas jiangduensis TaxID=1194168 RepID=UPI003BF89176